MTGLESLIWNYLNHNAAESGADVLLRQAADHIHKLESALKFISAQAGEHQRVAEAALDGEKEVTHISAPTAKETP
jgi:hypothetical protein